jgi:hypothetical protein
MADQLDVADHATPEIPAAVETTAVPAYEALTADRTEPKVAAATLSSALAALAVWLLSAYVFHGTVPDPVVGAVGLLITSGATYLGGYLARHVDRKA